MPVNKHTVGDLTVVDNIKHIAATATEAYSMKPYDQVVVMTLGAAASLTLTLPEVGEAAGKFYSLICTSRTTTGTCAVQDQDESYDWNGDYTIDVTADRLLLYSDGMSWWAVENMIA